MGTILSVDELTKEHQLRISIRIEAVTNYTVHEIPICVQHAGFKNQFVLLIKDLKVYPDLSVSGRACREVVTIIDVPYGHHHHGVALFVNSIVSKVQFGTVGEEFACTFG